MIRMAAAPAAARRRSPLRRCTCIVPRSRIAASGAARTSAGAGWRFRVTRAEGPRAPLRRPERRPRRRCRRGLPDAAAPARRPHDGSRTNCERGDQMRSGRSRVVRIGPTSRHAAGGATRCGAGRKTRSRAGTGGPATTADTGRAPASSTAVAESPLREHSCGAGDTRVPKPRAASWQGGTPPSPACPAAAGTAWEAHMTRHMSPAIGASARPAASTIEAVRRSFTSVIDREPRPDALWARPSHRSPSAASRARPARRGLQSPSTPQAAPRSRRPRARARADRAGTRTQRRRAAAIIGPAAAPGWPAGPCRSSAGTRPSGRSGRTGARQRTSPAPASSSCRVRRRRRSARARSSR